MHKSSCSTKPQQPLLYVFVTTQQWHYSYKLAGMPFLSKADIQTGFKTGPKMERSVPYSSYPCSGEILFWLGDEMYIFLCIA